VTRTYNVGGEVISAPNNVDLSIEEGSVVAIAGPLGSGAGLRLRCAPSWSLTRARRGPRPVRLPGLARQKTLERLVEVDALPRTASDKVLKEALRRQMRG